MNKLLQALTQSSSALDIYENVYTGKDLLQAVYDG